MKRALFGLAAVLVCAAVCTLSGAARAAGTLTPIDATYAPIEIVEHHVDVVLNNGFSRTEVRQKFHNPNQEPIDAIYEFPVPPDAALSQMIIQLGDRSMHGEVVGRDEARAIYEEQRAAGSTAGLATQNGYQTFQFEIAQIPASSDAEMSFVYYERLLIDTSVGRYLYPLQDGGTRDTAETEFWTRNEQVTGAFTFDLELKSALPVDEVRIAGLDSVPTETLGEGHYRVHLDAAPGSLGEDIVFYYRFAEGLPGRVEMIPYRPAAGGPGTFMMILTPGIDLAPLTGGRDFVFVLDVSGSMETKIHTLTSAVSEALLRLDEADRFRIVAFNTVAWDVTGEFQPATPANIAAAVSALEGLSANESTNLYAGLELALAGANADRVSGIVLVTDGVTNTGLVEPVAFDQLMRSADVRVFGLLLGNSANWPLMELITDVSGGFYAGVSNQDDILGQVMLADSKMTHESLHDAKLYIRGVDVYDTTDFAFGKVYRGQQLVVFGRYDQPGEASMELLANLSGRKVTYGTSFSFPAAAEENPELERLWALEMIHALARQRMLGLMPETEANAAIRDLGIAYQLVTDETSMLVVDDAVFAQYGIDLMNQDRTATEEAAQLVRSGSPATDYGIDGSNPAFPSTAPALGTESDEGDYGGAVDPLTFALGALIGLELLRRRPTRQHRDAAQGAA